MEVAARAMSYGAVRSGWCPVRLVARTGSKGTEADRTKSKLVSFANLRLEFLFRQHSFGDAHRIGQSGARQRQGFGAYKVI